LKYGSTASLHVSASSYETQDLKTENEKLKRHLQAYENQIKDLESELS
jgi:cell division protein FtsB